MVKACCPFTIPSEKQCQMEAIYKHFRNRETRMIDMFYLIMLYLQWKAAH